MTKRERLLHPLPLFLVLWLGWGIWHTLHFENSQTERVACFIGGTALITATIGGLAWLYARIKPPIVRVLLLVVVMPAAIALGALLLIAALFAP